ncbi:hypothetical protein AALM99_02630 [Lactococcus muris]|uniref:(+)RNA virus helicase C-terminal domain-containing protein n=1 Tax=Lactococcus muris TaxID=2941330 RepID=A0ABV4D6L2_9LACT
MVNKFLIQAVAGAGKTHEIVQRLNLSERNLIISFTNSNISNIKSEMRSQHDKIPENTKILTFSSFIYRWLIHPYEPSIILENKNKDFISAGVDTGTKPVENQSGYTPGYVKDNNLYHYVNPKNHRYYASRMSKLLVKQKVTVIKKILFKLSLFFDNIYIDEIQDFRGNDFRLLCLIYNYFNNNLVGVGDFYQHSVQKSDFRDNFPFQDRNKQFISLETYVKKFGTKVKLIDDQLIYSRRVPECVCEQIRKKLRINIFSKKEEGMFKVIDNVTELREVLSSPNLVGLIWNKKVKNQFNISNTWSACKGDTYENTCIVLTETLSSFVEDTFNCDNLSQESLNKLYVALTRATGNVYIVQKSIYDAI